MKIKRIPLLLATALTISLPLGAQSLPEGADKADPATRAILYRLNMQRDAAQSAALHSRGLTPDSAQLMLRVTEADGVMQKIEGLGGRGCRISSGIVTATVPATALPALLAMPEVTRINHAQQKYALTDEARTLTGVDRVLSGTGLETPFTGKGVIVTVVDRGFQFNHRAFLKDATTSRALYTWNHNKSKTPPQKGATLLRGSDGQPEEGGHATHVAGIAAGSKVEGVPYHGMAPEADLVLISSTYMSTDILEEIAWAKSVAQDEGKPMVVNMSFGTDIHPHDGYGDEKEVSELADNGFILVAAAGNSNGDKIHVERTLQNKGDSVVFALDNKANDCLMCFVGQPTDGQEHLSFSPCLYNKKTKTYTSFTESQLADIGYCGGDMAEGNGRQAFIVNINQSRARSVAGITDATNTYMVVVVRALTDSVRVHGWRLSKNGFVTLGSGVGVAPDDRYVIGDYASGEKIIGVGSFVGRHDWPMYATGTKVQSTESTTGKLSDFSNQGPTIDEGERPLVAAPGGQIISALNSFADASTGASSLDLTSWLVTAGINSNGQAVPYSQSNRLKHFFYGMKSGTSMASPATTGIIALWLQANPELNYDQIERIIQATSTHDSFTDGTAGTWTKGWGYGKINAYDGLKMAIELAEADGITPMIGAEEPVSFDRQPDAWRILFHTPCHQAVISLHALSGTQVAQTTLHDIRPGNEHTVALDGLPKGGYLLTVQTPQAKLTRKILVP